MALNWNSVNADHIALACQHIRDDGKRSPSKSQGIFVIYEDAVLPAKQVMRFAYLLANSMPLDTKLKFSSGESTVKRLRGLGFEVERRAHVQRRDQRIDDTRVPHHEDDRPLAEFVVKLNFRPHAPDPFGAQAHKSNPGELDPEHPVYEALPAHAGRLPLAGLREGVEVLRDEQGVPRIRAAQGPPKKEGDGF